MSAHVINLHHYKIRRKIDRVKQILFSPNVVILAVITAVTMLLALGCFELSTTDAVKSYYQMYGNEQLQGFFYYGT